MRDNRTLSFHLSIKTSRLISRYEYSVEPDEEPITRTRINATLLWGDQAKSLWVLIERFIDTTFVSELGISTQPLSIPMEVRALDGRSIGRVTRNTIPVDLRVSGNAVPAHQISPCTRGFGIVMAPEAQPPSRLGYWFYRGMEPVLPCAVS